MKLSAGQFRYTFGYEAQQSDADREMPQRAPVGEFFFDGERDRGLRLQGSYPQNFNFAVAFVNGTIFDGKKNLAANEDTGFALSFRQTGPEDEFKETGSAVSAWTSGILWAACPATSARGLPLAPPVAATADKPAIPDTPDSDFDVPFGRRCAGVR